ncbi:isoprenoid synthase domain-containing protein [Panaeolus papilionaceus]|nr:isoprenoid synthase domain-containing protein [Panaeolus papilionaceus]
MRAGLSSTSLQSLKSRLLQRVSHHSLRHVTTEAAVAPSHPDAYCRDYVRKHDYDSYLISHFYPKHAQPGYFAIKAFSVELASIADTVSNTVIGQMRMQFWRDAVKSINDGRPTKHPIALALYEASKKAKLSSYHLKRMVDARDAELQSPSYLTVDSLTSHAEATSSTVLYLLLQLLSVPSSDVSHAASHLGTAQTFSTLLRALPYHAKKGQMIIPAELTAKHGVNQEEVFRYGPEAPGLESAVFDFATIAHDHLLTARDMISKMHDTNGRVLKESMPVLVSAVPVSNYLKRLEESEFNAFEPKLQVRDGWLPWYIWKSYYKKEF